MTAASGPGPADQGEPPATVWLAVPAHLSFLATIRTAVGAVVREVGGSSTCARDLQLASDEAAAVLIGDAPAWTEIQLSIAHDDADIYVRIVTKRVQPGRPLAIHELTQLLLSSVVQSHEIFADGQRCYAFLQTSRDGVGPWS